MDKKLQTGNIESIRVGRAEEGWCAVVARIHYGFWRNRLEYEHYQKADGENFWEDDDGWYIDGTSPLHTKLEQAVAAFTPWKSEKEESAF